MLALGLVETCGLVGAIEAADAMLKSADVTLLERNCADAGLVTITVAGEVSAVQASVNAAAARVREIAGTVLLSAHVIPRPDAELETILRLDPDDGGDPGAQSGPCSGIRTVPAYCPAPKPAPQAEEKAPSDPEEKESAGGGEPELRENQPEALEQEQKSPSITLGRLKNMSLAKLRQTAREIEGTGLSENDIAASDRRTLIAAITQALRNIEE